MKIVYFRIVPALTLVLGIFASLAQPLLAEDGPTPPTPAEADPTALLGILLEIQLADAESRNDRLQAEMTKLQSAQAVGTTDKSQELVDGLLRQVTELEKELVALRAQVAEQNGGDATSAEVLAEFEARCRNLEDESAILKGQVNDLKGAIEKSEQESTDYQVALGKRDKQLEDLQVELKDAMQGAENVAGTKGLRKELEGRVKTLQGELKDVTRENIRLSDHAAQLQQDIHIAESANATAAKALKTMASKVTSNQKVAAESAVAQREQESTDYQVALGKRDKQLEDLQAELKDALKGAENAAGTKGLRKELEGRVKTLQGELKDVTRENKRLSDHATQLQQDIHIAESANANATKALKTMASKVTSNQKVAAQSAVAQREQTKQLRKIQDEYAAASDRLSELTKDNAQLIKTVARHEASRDEALQLAEVGVAAKQSSDSLAKQLASLAKQLTEEKNRTGSLMGEVSMLRKSSDALQIDKLGLDALVADLRMSGDPTRRNELRDELAAIRATESERRGTMEGLFAQLASVKGSLGESEARSQKATQQLDEAQDELKGLEKKLAKALVAPLPLEKVIAGLRQDIKALDADKAQLDVALSARGDAVDMEVAKLRALQSEIDQLAATDRQRRIAMDEVISKLATAERKNTMLQKEADAAKATHETQLAALSGEMSRAQGDLNQFQTASADFSTQLDQVKSGTASLRAERDSSRVEAEKLRLAVATAEAAASDVQQRYNRLQMTDQQRKQAMDELLEKMAGMAIDGQKVSAELTVTRSKLSQQIDALRGESESSSLENKRLASELATIEAELAAAVSVRASLVSDVDKHGAVEVALRKRVSELESLLAEQRTIDDQRKRNMDHLLSDLGKLETSNSAIVAANKSLEQRLAAASAAPAMVDVPAGADPALAQDLANLQQAYQLSQAETQAQQMRVAELEAKLAAGAGGDLLATVAPPSLDLGTADAALVAARQQWAVEADALQTQLAEQTAAQTELAAAHAACGGAPKELAELKAQRAKLVRENEGLRKKIVNVRDTDLFKQIEKANVVLRDKVVKIEEERQRLETQIEKIEKQLREQERELRTSKSEVNRSTADLQAASDREGEHRTLIEKLMIQMPELEQDIVRLQDSLSQKETLLVERSRALETLKVEMEKREHRLLKAQRTAQILEDAREDVVHTNDREKRDMHYNMAMVYSREKRHAEAEGEYLKALRLDPTDADIHYNLAILYDDELESPEKAVLHYKRYLKLSPHGPDADAVRSWLMKLEVK